MSDDDDLHSEQSDDEAPLPSEQPTVDAANRRSVRKRERKAVADQKDADQFWRDVFASPVGRREMWRLLETAHAFEERFACGPNGFPQPDATAYQRGERDFGLRLYHSWIIIDRDGVFLMHDEHDQRFKSRAAKRES